MENIKYPRVLPLFLDYFKAGKKNMTDIMTYRQTTFQRPKTNFAGVKGRHRFHLCFKMCSPYEAIQSGQQVIKQSEPSISRGNSW